MYVLTDLGTLGGSISWATGINNQGVVVGDSTLPGDTVQHGFAWSQGAMHDLGAYRPDLSSHAGTSNNAGQIVGAWDVSDVPSPDNTICWTPGPCHLVLWSHGVPQELVGLGGVNSGENDLNERGQVVGVAEPADVTPFGPCGGWCRPRKPTLWQGNAVTVLPSLGGPSGAARSINDRGQIVGRADLSATIDPLFNQTDFHATMWYRGHVQDLGQRPPAECPGLDSR
jgi:probable HAF family extracellular repeat protein